MQVLDNISALKDLCRLHKKWGIYYQWPAPPIDVFEMKAAAPWFNYEDEAIFQSVADGNGFMLFDTEEECYQIYYQTIGQDGPRANYTNNYHGPFRVYMITCNPDGETVNENT